MHIHPWNIIDNNTMTNRNGIYIFTMKPSNHLDMCYYILIGLSNIHIIPVILLAETYHLLEPMV